MRAGGVDARLALFAPLPPAPSGIADYVVDLLPLLPDTWAIDVFVDDAAGAAAPATRSVEVHAASQWRALHRVRPYDLNVYQVGNSTSQAWMWPWALAVPGLLVLHDAILHPARVAAHLAAADVKGYRRSAAAARPDVGAALGELVASGLAGESLFRAFPLCEDLVRASRLTGVHGPLLAGWLRALVPDAEIVALTHWRAVPEAERSRCEAWRRRFGGAGTQPLIGSFGHLGTAHRSDLLLGALSALRTRHDFRLVFAGAAADRQGLARQVAALDLEDRVSFTGPLSPADFGAVMRVVDIAVNLRYPTVRSSSGTMQQLLQLGVPVVIHDLVHLRDVPEDAVGRVPTGTGASEHDALCQVLDAWLGDPTRRRSVGAAAAAWAARHITPAAMRASYEAAVERALGRPAAA